MGLDRVSGVPSGIITMWSGGANDLPKGWTLCDGTDGAPNLQDQFTVGAGNEYNTGETGGEDEVQLSEDELASHNHSDGSLSASNHDHGNGSLSTDNHRHGDGSLSASNHSHSDGSLDTDVSGNHDHNANEYMSGGGGSFEVSEDVDGASDDVADWKEETGLYAEGAGRSSNLYNTETVSVNSGSGSIAVGIEDAGSHSHDVTGQTGSETPSVSGNTGSSGANVSGSTSYANPNVNGLTGSTGSNNAHENRPSYYAVAYIMKL